jgi:hypothetical protein
MNDQAKSLQARTDAKLRCARVHLDELALLASLDGSDFDRAHQESFLFHLFGARDALLIELNHYYRAGLPIQDLTQGRLRDTLKERGILSAELACLFELGEGESSWFRQIKDMRDHSAHVQGVPRHFALGGEDDGRVQLRNPRTGNLSQNHVLHDLQRWLEQMRALVAKLRQSASAQM